MKLGGLSETDVEKIIKILKIEGISFEVTTDQDMEQFNSISMKNNLRHFSPPNISTHVLAVEINDDEYHKISASGKSELAMWGISDIAPLPEDFQSITGENILKEIADAPRRVVAFNFKHQLVLTLIILIFYFAFKYFS